MPDEPATKQDLRDLEARLDRKLNALESRIRTAVEESETRILTAVDGCAETIDARLDAGTRRFAGVEERLNLPPAA
jgi:hypothetical protein